LALNITQDLKDNIPAIGAPLLVEQGAVVGAPAQFFEPEEPHCVVLKVYPQGKVDVLYAPFPKPMLREIFKACMEAMVDGKKEG
jgi:hypothetical protein